MPRQIKEIPLARIRTNKQVRETFPQEPIEFLGESAKEIGFVQPILVRPDGNDFVIIDGERRYRAATLMGLESISAIVEEQALSEEQIVERQLVTNCLREPLSIMEKVRGMDRLVRGGRSISEVAKKVSLSVAQASKDLALLTLSAEIQKLIDDGAIPKSKGYELTLISDPAKQRAMADEMVRKHLTRDQVAAQRKRLEGNSASSEPKAVAVLGGGRRVIVSGPGLTLESLAAWLMELCGLARKARSQGVTLDTFCRTLKDRKDNGGGKEVLP